METQQMVFAGESPAGLRADGESAQKKANPYSIVERYTGAVRRAILHARDEAICRGEAVLTVADLLAGLCAEENTRAERVGQLKIHAQYLRWLSELSPLPRREPPAAWKDYAGQCELNPEARRALACAVLEADRDGEHWIDSDHLLRGLLRFPNRAQFAILKTELNLRAARLASFHDRDKFLPEDGPHPRIMDTLIGKYFPQWAAPLLSAVCYLYILLQSFGLKLAPLAR